MEEPIEESAHPVTAHETPDRENGRQGYVVKHRKAMPEKWVEIEAYQHGQRKRYQRANGRLYQSLLSCLHHVPSIRFA